MKFKIIVGVTLCAIFLFIGGMIAKKFYDKKTRRGDMEMINQIKTVKELHTISCLFDDLVFIHRKDDPSKSLWAILKIPVEVSAYTDLEKVDYIIKNDTLTEIVLPNAVLSDPNYQLDKSTAIKVRSFQFHIGSNNYVNTINIIKERIKEGKISINQRAVEHGILKQADQEAEKYFQTLMSLFGKKNVQISFANNKLLDSIKTESNSIDSLNRIVNIRIPN